MILLDKQVRDAYWIVALIGHEGMINVKELAKRMYQPLNDVKLVCGKLLQANILSFVTGRTDAYCLARSEHEIRLSEIHHAFDPGRHQETLSIVLFMDGEFLDKQCLSDLLKYEREESHHIVNSLVL